MPDLAEILPTMRRLLEKLEAETASQTEGIAALVAMLTRSDAGLAASVQSPPQTPQESTATTGLERLRLSRRMRRIVAGAILLAVLACTAAGIWL